MSSDQPPVRAIELLQTLKLQNDEILVGIRELLSETREVKKINDDQLAELKNRGGNPN